VNLNKIRADLRTIHLPRERDGLKTIQRHET